MNVKPGDLAVITKGDYSGLIVSVLHAAPEHDFILPDSFPAYGQKEAWVIEHLGSGFMAPVGTSSKNRTGYRQAKYAVCRDIFLKPLRYRLEDDETITWAGKPEKESRE